MDNNQTQEATVVSAEIQEYDEGGRGARGHDYRAKLAWILERAQHYSQVTGVAVPTLLDAWEARRNYWYMNYYQDCNQPKLDVGIVRIFDTDSDLHVALGTAGYRCPRCGGVSTDPYACNSGLDMEPSQTCDWKVYGLFGDLGKGVYIFVKSAVAGQTIFMPVAWETAVAQNAV